MCYKDQCTGKHIYKGKECRNKTLEQKKQEEKKYLEKHVRNDNGAAERKNIESRKKEKCETRRPRKE